MKRTSFTMIEILVVIAIIVIVMGLLIPAASTVLKKANVNKTKTAIRTLQMAIKQYEATYSTLPFTNTYNADTLLNDPAYDNLLSTLAALNSTFNPRLIKFLEVDKNNDYKDAWDNDLSVSLDLNHSGSLDNDKVYGLGQLSTSIAIWSKGPDETHSATDGNSGNEDNINSWD